MTKSVQWFNRHNEPIASQGGNYWERMSLAEGRLWDFAASQVGPVGHKVRAKAFELGDRYHEHMTYNPNSKYDY